MLRYIIIVVLLVLALFGLIWLSEKMFARYGNFLAEKFENKKGGKNFSFDDLSSPCLIAALIFFIIAAMPDMNSALFITMAIVFLLRSLRGKISVFRVIWLLIGSFSLGVVISISDAGTMELPAILILFLISVPMLILGFKKPSKSSIKTGKDR